MNYEIVDGPAWSGKHLWSWYPPTRWSWLLPSVSLSTAFQESRWFVEQFPHADPRRFQVGHLGVPLRGSNLWIECRGSVLGRFLALLGSLITVSYAVPDF